MHVEKQYNTSKLIVFDMTTYHWQSLLLYLSLWFPYVWNIQSQVDYSNFIFHRRMHYNWMV